MRTPVIEPAWHSALPLGDCLAKSVRLEDGRTVPGMDVLMHCRVVGLVARNLVARYTGFIDKSLFPPGTELVAALHDVGKISPTFQEKIRRALTGYKCNSLPQLNTADPEIEQNWGGHSGASQAAVEGVGKYIPEILGMHHGAPPQNSVSKEAEVLGGKEWQARREELIGKLRVDFSTEWPSVQSAAQASAMAGLTTVADWIGSGSAFDGIQSEFGWNGYSDPIALESAVNAAIDAAGFVRPRLRSGLSFQDIFGFKPLPVQSVFFESVSAPGVYVLEAPMGLGKTEAALYAAYRVMEAGKASGIYFALPTQLTSDSIHGRVVSFLDSILADDSPWKSVLLLHGAAWIRESELGEEGRPGGSWFDSRKRGLLAPFGVGTIDQALMAVINVRHSFVRSFALARKVVILDEVHSYDGYTGTLLTELVNTLAELGATVIVLSATLTGRRRGELVATSSGSDRADAPYPLVSMAPRGVPASEVEVPELPDARVIINLTSDEDAALDEALFRASGGQQVLWIENTVAEAQARFRIISVRAAECGIEVGLLHSRFTKADRRRQEEKWVTLYGKSGRDLRGSSGRFLVGTQVLEQSLDIDADFLVSRHCPMDMLLQRCGRLWRHRENDSLRPPASAREVLVLRPDDNDVNRDPMRGFGPSGYVYAPYVLYRTLRVLESVSYIDLPSSIRPLLEATYADREEDGGAARCKADLEKRRQRLRSLALISMSSFGATAQDEVASTRYSETESVDLLLLRDRSATLSGCVLLRMVDGELVELPRNPSVRERKKIAALLMEYIVSVPISRAPRAFPSSALSWLAPYLYIGNSDFTTLRVALLSPDGSLAGLSGEEPEAGSFMTYTSGIGFESGKTDAAMKEEGW